MNNKNERKPFHDLANNLHGSGWYDPRDIVPNPGEKSEFRFDLMISDIFDTLDPLFQSLRFASMLTARLLLKIGMFVGKCLLLGFLSIAFCLTAIMLGVKDSMTRKCDDDDIYRPTIF